MIKGRLSTITESAKTLINYETGLPATQREKALYKQVMTSIMKKMFIMMVKEGCSIVLPHIGRFQVMKFKMQRLKDKRKNKGKGTYDPVDLNKLAQMRKLGEVTKFPKLNYKITDGYWWRLVWNKKGMFTKRAIYSLRFTKSNRKVNMDNKIRPEVTMSNYFITNGHHIYKEIFIDTTGKPDKIINEDD